MQFTEQLCTLQAHFLKKPLVIGKDFKGLYLLDSKEIQEAWLPANRKYFSSVCATNKGDMCDVFAHSVQFTTWHNRLGHMSHSKMQSVSSFLKLQGNKTDFVCDICPKAKQHRLPFPVSSTITSTCIFELIHIDTWGPYHSKTHSGHKYFLTIADDFSRSTWTYLMVTKDEAMSIIKSFTSMAHTQFDSTVKAIRTNNALELSTSHEALDFFAKTGILHQTSCTQTP